MENMVVAFTGRAPGSLPSNTKINPKEHAKAITTPSGVQLPEIHVKRLGVNQETSPPIEDETIEQDEQPKESTPKESSKKSWDKTAATVNPYEPPILFPQRLKKHKMEQQYTKFFEVFKKLMMPSYAKFLKEILSNKCKSEEHEMIMLTEKSLCDLVASINLMSLSLFRKLGLREAKATTVTLQLADRSLTHLIGIIEDKGQLILRLGEEQISFNVSKAMKLHTELDSYF
ncbi:uncharacterized protein LOC111381043 [Olea europaea var. sylvestris]|uniref:uncharacterized protein LOC111381043 n=1 Tax=Olea europaea var. sylvestris TaxID=158386 RepID=UPI000C1D1C0D|nr:uncharacterized protein LOC111381043 [Olea europaea var. sylvestris]